MHQNEDFHRYARSRKSQIHNLQFHSACPKHQWLVNFNTAYWITAKIEPFLTISILKFLSYPRLCLFYFSKKCCKNWMLMQIFESLLRFFWIGNIIFVILLSTYLERTGRNIILCVKMLLLRNKSHMLILMIEVKIEM